MTSRYAIYHVPDVKSACYQRVSDWLGYSIHDGLTVSRPSLPESLTAFTGFTRRARGYGCHATLKPLFRLKPGLQEKHLVKIFKHFARIYAPIRCPGMRIDSIGQFLALTPQQPCPTVDELATDCVQTFDLFRDEAGETETNRYQPGLLSANQQRLLHQWGYPYVLDEFRLHITLTDPLPRAAMNPCQQALLDYLQPCLDGSFLVDSISLCHRAGAGQPFTIIDTRPLKG